MSNGDDEALGNQGADGGDAKPAKRHKSLRAVSAAGLALGLAAGGAAVAGATTSGSTGTHSLSAGQRPPGGSPPAAVGTVATVGTSSFTIKTKDGTIVTVDVNGSTTYRDRGVSSPTLANVTVGETVAAFGTDTANTVAATSVAIGDPGGPGRHGGPGGPGGPGGSPPAAVGTVATVGTSSFTIKTKGGTIVTVDVNGSTTYRDRGVSSPTLANVTVGGTVAAFGTDTANTVAATSVAIGDPGGPGRHGGPGSGAGDRGGPPPAQ